jgi:hypothetical protein
MKLAEVEKRFILKKLAQCNYNRTHTAKALGIGLRTLQRKLKIYGLSNLGLNNYPLSGMVINTNEIGGTNERENSEVINEASY